MEKLCNLLKKVFELMRLVPAYEPLALEDHLFLILFCEFSIFLVEAQLNRQPLS